MMNVTLGDSVKDPVTKVEGVAYCYITYLQGCERIGIQQPAYKNNEGEVIVPELYYVDEPQLVVIKKSKKTYDSKDGGPSGFQKSHKNKV